jgi:hypothetical protein
VKFFLDNNLSPKLAKCLHVLTQPEHEVVHLKELFAANTPDEVWMRALAAEKDWVIVSMDTRITKNPHEIKAWREAGHTTFFLKKAWTHLGFWEQAQKFVKCFPDLSDAASRSPGGSMHFVSVHGKIES